MLLFIKFGFVGGLGVLTNLVCFILFSQHLHYLLNSFFCFCIAVSQNFFIHYFYTFKHKGFPPIKTYFLFVLSSILGFGINLTVLYLGVNFLFHRFYFEQFFIGEWMAQLLGIFAGMGSNFIVSKLIIFKEKPC